MLLIKKYRKNPKLSKVSRTWVEKNKDKLAYCYKCRYVYNNTITRCINKCYIESVSLASYPIKLSYGQDILRHLSNYLYRLKLIEEGKRGFKLNYYNNTTRRSKVCNKNVNNVKEKSTTTTESELTRKLSATSATAFYVGSTERVSSTTTNLRATTRR